MRKIVFLLFVIIFFVVSCGEDALVGQAGYQQLTFEQKQFYWNCWNGHCKTLLDAKDPGYRSCSLECFDQATLVSPKQASCTDSDDTDYFTKGIVKTNIYPQGKEDSCYTFPNGKTYLFEGQCVNKKYQYIQKNCAKLGSDYTCVDGKCEVLPQATANAASFLPEVVDQPEVLNAKTFGALPDDNIDDTQALQAGITAAFDQKTALYIPSGTYHITSSLQIPAGSYSGFQRALRITGDNAVIKAMAPMDAVLNVGDFWTYFTIDHLVLDANNQANYGFKAVKISLRLALVEHLLIRNALQDGLYLDRGQGSIFRHIVSMDNGGNGVYCVDCNSAVFDDVTASGNGKSGFVINRQEKGFSGPLILRSFYSINNQEHGVLIKADVEGSSLRDGWVEGNGLDGIRIETNGVLIEKNTIIGTEKSNGYAIHLIPGVNDGTKSTPKGIYSGGSKVLTNSLVGSDVYAIVKDETGTAATTILSGNKKVSSIEEKPVISLELSSLAIAKNVINVKAEPFLAKGDGKTDDTLALQIALNGATPDSIVYIPRGTYLINTGLSIPQSGLTIIGDWAIIRAASPMEAVLNISSKSKIHLRRIMLDANGLANNAFLASLLDDASLQQVAFLSALSYDLLLVDAKDVTLRGTDAWRSRGYGIYCQNCHHVVFDAVAARDNFGTGIVLNATSSSEGVQVTNLLIERNKEYGLVIEPAVKDVVIRDGWLEANGWTNTTAWFEQQGLAKIGEDWNMERTDNLRIGGSGITIDGLKTHDYAPLDPIIKRAIRLTPSASEITVVSNLFVNWGNTKYGTIRDESGLKTNKLEGNYYRTQWGNILPIINDFPCPADKTCIERPNGLK